MMPTGPGGQNKWVRLVIPPGVFRPRSDSWQLADVVSTVVTPGDEVLDLCSGSGAVALSAARAGAGHVVAIDVSRLAVATVRLNAMCRHLRVTARRGDLFAPVAGRRFHLITANPPYLPQVGESSAGPSRLSRGLATAVNGGPDGRAILDRIIAAAPDYLCDGGQLLVVHSSVCGVTATEDAMHRAHLTPTVMCRQRGPLGPLLSARVTALRAAGTLAGSTEDIVVVRGTLGFAPSLAG